MKLRNVALETKKIKKIKVKNIQLMLILFQVTKMFFMILIL